MTRLVCVTATGTGVGKTLITGALVWQALKAGKRAFALKPVISGYEGTATDTHLLLDAQGMKATEEAIERVSPWRFADPVSPHIAAARAGVSLTAQDIARHCIAQAQGSEIAFIEGAGGMMAPISLSETFLDIAALLDAEIILVAGSYLGTLSHTLTALEALKARRMTPRLLVVSESEKSPMPLAETLSSLQNFAPGVPMLAVPRLAGASRLWPFVPDLFTSIA